MNLILNNSNGSFAFSHFIHLFYRKYFHGIHQPSKKKGDDDSQTFCAQFFVIFPTQIIIIYPVSVLSLAFHGQWYFFRLIQPTIHHHFYSDWPQERSKNDSTEIITKMSLQFVQFAETSRNAKNDLTIESMSYTYKLLPTHQVENFNGQLNKLNKNIRNIFDCH